MDFYIIYRDTLTKIEKRPWLKRVRREYLYLTKTGKRVWKPDLQMAIKISGEESIHIMDNLEKANRRRFSYGKVWQYHT